MTDDKYMTSIYIAVKYRSASTYSWKVEICKDIELERTDLLIIGLCSLVQNCVELFPLPLFCYIIGENTDLQG